MLQTPTQVLQPPPQLLSSAPTTTATAQTIILAPLHPAAPEHAHAPMAVGPFGGMLPPPVVLRPGPVPISTLAALDTNGHSAVDLKRRHGDPGADSNSELIAPPNLAGTRLHAGSVPPTNMLNIDTPRPSKHGRLALQSSASDAAGQPIMSSASATFHAPHSDVQSAPVVAQPVKMVGSTTPTVPPPQCASSPSPSLCCTTCDSPTCHPNHPTPSPYR